MSIFFMNALMAMIFVVMLVLVMMLVVAVQLIMELRELRLEHGRIVKELGTMNNIINRDKK